MSSSTGMSQTGLPRLRLIENQRPASDLGQLPKSAIAAPPPKEILANRRISMSGTRLARLLLRPKPPSLGLAFQRSLQ